MDAGLGKCERVYYAEDVSSDRDRLCACAREMYEGGALLKPSGDSVDSDRFVTPDVSIVCQAHAGAQGGVFYYAVVFGNVCTEGEVACVLSEQYIGGW